MTFPPSSLSLEQYRAYFTESNWWSSTVLSFWIAIASTTLAILIGVPAAYSLVRSEFRGKRLLTLFLLSPIMAPIVVVALGLYLYFATIGVHGPAIPIVLGHVLIAFPFVIVTCMAGMQNVDRNLEIASQIMGAGPFTVFRKVTLPLLRPTIIASALFAFVISFDELVISYFVGKAGFSTLPVKMFGSIQWDISPVIAAISTLLTVFSLIVCLIAASSGHDK
ncbi:ABC transporter permease [Rhodobacteraceae bacterium LMO-12]|nr:ABC transporter permease [Rhodobacteraceae bacterium LMO-JJ12]